MHFQICSGVVSLPRMEDDSVILHSRCESRNRLRSSRKNSASIAPATVTENRTRLWCFPPVQTKLLKREKFNQKLGIKCDFL